MPQGRFFCHAIDIVRGGFPLNDKLIVFIDIVRGDFPLNDKLKRN